MKTRLIKVTLLGTEVEFPVEVHTKEEMIELYSPEGVAEILDSLDERIKAQEDPKWWWPQIFKKLMFEAAAQVDITRLEDDVEFYQELVSDGYMKDEKGKEVLRRNQRLLDAVKILRGK